MKQRFRFEKLDVWHDSRLLYREVSRAARRSPKEEVFALASQVRRAASSVSANIAEGSGRNSDPDFARFLEQPYGSLMEVASHLHLALDDGYITEDYLDGILEQADLLAGRTVSLHQSLTADHSKTPFVRKRAIGRSPLAPRPSTPFRS